MEVLDSAARARYARHLLIPEIGEAGQRRLLNSSVLVAGAGGLGSPALTYLAAAGVGRIGIVDDDVVDASNLHRQVIHTTGDVGRPKTDSAADRLHAINPDIDVIRYSERLTAQNARSILEGYDVVIDGTDNFATRYLLSDSCALLGIPEVWGAVFRLDGAVTVFHRGAGPCYRCMHSRPPAPGSVPSSAEAGVLGPLPGIIGTMQAIEAIKVITGAGRPLIGRVNSYAVLDGTWRTIELRPNPSCPVCGPQPAIRTWADLAAAHQNLDAIVLSGGRASRLDGADKGELNKDGVTLLTLAVQAVGAASTIVVVGPAPKALQANDGRVAGRQVHFTREDPPWSGPAAAIGAGVESLPAACDGLVVLLACDMPSAGKAIPVVRATAARAVVDGHDGAIGVDDAGRRQYLLCCVSLPALRAALAAEAGNRAGLHNAPLRAVVDRLDLIEVPLPHGSADDVDTPQDAERAGVTINNTRGHRNAQQ